MIPKIIHYIWFGGKEEPHSLQLFISSWKNHMPDWEIKRWDESNFDINSSLFCSQAYAARKWAFAADYARIKILYDEGGIYLDTDEEIVKSLNPFLSHQAFFGMEAGGNLQAGVLGCEPQNKFIGELLKYYNNLSFIDDLGKMNESAIGVHIEHLLSKLYPNFKKADTIQSLGDGIYIYPSCFFCPDLLNLEINDNTYSIHRPNGSWLNWRQRLKQRFFLVITNSTLLSRIYSYLKR